MKFDRRCAIIGSLAASLLVAAYTPAAAQSEQDAKNFLAYLALSLTPPGALPPLLTRSMAGGPRALGGVTSPSSTGLGALQVAGRYGRSRIGTDSPDEDATFNTFVGTALFSAGEAATITGSVGIIDPTCSAEDCDSQWVFSVGGDVALGGTTLGATPTSPRLSVGLSGEIGYTSEDELSALGAMAGVPVSIVLGSGQTKFVPYLVPGLGFGRTRVDPEDAEESAARFLLGGGVGLMNLTSMVNVSVGFQKIFFSAFGIESKTTFGLAVTIGR
jgi:hypothetical protein